MKGALEPETVFDGLLLRARLTRPRKGGTVLYITFRQWLDQPGSFTDEPPVRQALARGLAHLHIQSRWNDWYLNAETPALEAVLRQLRGRFTSARAVGYSMGGYAALRLASALDLDQALVISPQFTLDATVLPEEDRYIEAAAFDRALGDLDRHAKTGLHGVVVYDPSHPLDRRHARLISRAMPRIAPAACMFGGHPATSALRAAGGFGTLQGLGLSSDLSAPAVVALHRRLRAGSSRYWQARATACLARGKTIQADLALTRAEALAEAVALSRA